MVFASGSSLVEEMREGVGEWEGEGEGEGVGEEERSGERPASTSYD